MLGRYVQLVCNLSESPLFDATDNLGRCERFCVGPAMQFTHRPLRWESQRASDLNYENVIRPFETKRVVLLIRHPLDALVSLWMQRKYQTSERYGGGLNEFLSDPIFGIEKLFRFYSLWFDYCDRPKDFLLMRYEDMRKDPNLFFLNLLHFVNIPVRESDVRQAVEDAHFDTMKKIEISGGGPKYRSSGLAIFGPGDKNNPDALHVRRGKVGGFVDYLAPRDVEELTAQIERKLPAYFGYSSHRSR